MPVTEVLCVLLRDGPFPQSLGRSLGRVPGSRRPWANCKHLYSLLGPYINSCDGPTPAVPGPISRSPSPPVTVAVTAIRPSRMPVVVVEATDYPLIATWQEADRHWCRVAD